MQLAPLHLGWRLEEGEVEALERAAKKVPPSPGVGRCIMTVSNLS
jgi:hypothetical protein